MLLREFIRFLSHRINTESNLNSSEDRITPLHGSILVWELIKFFNKFEQVDSFKETLKSLNILSKEFDYRDVTLRNGMYMRGLCDAIFEIEELYSCDLNKLERALIFKEGVPELAINDPSLEFGSSAFSVCKMSDTYTMINQIINLLLENNLCGCQILDLSLKFKYRLSEEIFCILVNHLNRRLIKQISCWIVFGKLEDPYDEFFIKHVDSVRPGLSDTLDTLSNTTGSTCYTSTSELVEEIYEIDSNFLPCHVSFSLANKILNVGKLVSLLRRAPAYTSGSIPFDNCSFGINESEIIKSMKDLEENHDYHLTKLEEVVNFVWISVNKQLKKLAEDVGCLFLHQRMLMDIYLLQRGELMSDFVKRTCHILQSDARRVPVYTLNTAFRRAVNDCASNLHTYSDLLTFSLPYKNIIPEGTSCISVLEIQFKTPWPLHFIFSADVMEKYNIIFRFLVELKCVHLNLLNTWKECSLHSQLPTELLYVMYKFQLLLNNLESYVFVDVIQSENEMWEAGVKKAESFNDIKVVHMNFLSNLIFNLFLIHTKQVVQTSRRKSTQEAEIGRMIILKKLSELFSITNQFCYILKNYQTNPGFKRQLRKINTAFKELVKNIVRIIHENYKENDQPRLLLMRLNYNNFYSPL